MSVLADLLIKKQLCPIPIPSVRCVLGLCSSTALACRQDLCGTWWWQWWKGRGTAVTAPVGVQPWEHRRMDSAGLALLSWYLNNGGKIHPCQTNKFKWSLLPKLYGFSVASLHKSLLPAHQCCLKLHPLVCWQTAMCQWKSVLWMLSKTFPSSFGVQELF